jgi:hypothetical protein
MMRHYGSPCETSGFTQATVLAWMWQVMTRLGLTVNEAKTTVSNARQERFDFLGYSFGPHTNRNDGQPKAPGGKIVAARHFAGACFGRGSRRCRLRAPGRCGRHGNFSWRTTSRNTSVLAIGSSRRSDFIDARPPSRNDSAVCSQC